MLIAILSSPIQVGEYQTLFPYTSFTESGPTPEWLAENNCAPVSVWLPYDQATQVLQTVDPYLQEGVVYTVIVRDMTLEEKTRYDDNLKAQNKNIAAQRLQETDWVDLGPVGDPMVLPHLANVAEFNSYRLALRTIAVNPPVTVDPWPVKPEEIWVTE